MSLVFNKIIDFIFKAVFFIKARVNIGLHGTAFCYSFEILSQICSFENRGILGWLIMLQADWLIQRLTKKWEQEL